MSNFWDFIWLIASTFLFVAYLLILFRIIADLFQDSELGGGSKALWLICLIFLPMLTALVYVIARGKSMAERQRAAFERSRSEAESYIRQVAGKSPAEQIADAKALLDKYIAQKMSEKGIKKYTTGKKDVKCELYLNLIVFDEHTCRAEASVCWDGAPLPKSETLAGELDKTAGKPKPAADKSAAPKPAASKAADVKKPADASATGSITPKAAKHAKKKSV